MPRNVHQLQGGEYVRLLRDFPQDDVRAGSVGVLWGVYAFEPPVLEATFLSASGGFEEVMLELDDIELVGPSDAPPKIVDLGARLGAWKGREESNQRAEATPSERTENREP